jgi:DNA-binding IclR family transcriptional regulator
MEEKDNRYHAPALDKGLDILEYLASQSVPQSQTEIGTALEKSPNEIYRMLMCLESRGYILRDEHSSKYKLSLKMYHLSHRHSPIEELRRAAQHPMEELAQSIRQSCHLSILYHEEVMVMISIKSPDPISLFVEEGNLFPLSLTASGKVLMAFMEETEQKRLIRNSKSLQKFTTRQLSEFASTLKKIRQQRFYVVSSDLAEGIVDIAVPIGNTESGVTTCLTVSSLVKPKANKGIQNERILSETFSCSKKIEKRMGMITAINV